MFLLWDFQLIGNKQQIGIQNSTYLLTEPNIKLKRVSRN